MLISECIIFIVEENLEDDLTEEDYCNMCVGKLFNMFQRNSGVSFSFPWSKTICQIIFPCLIMGQVAVDVQIVCSYIT